jgi:hypothetical protein
MNLLQVFISKIKLIYDFINYVFLKITYYIICKNKANKSLGKTMTEYLSSEDLDLLLSSNQIELIEKTPFVDYLLSNSSFDGIEVLIFTFF